MGDLEFHRRRSTDEYRRGDEGERPEKHSRRHHHRHHHRSSKHGDHGDGEDHHGHRHKSAKHSRDEERDRDHYKRHKGSRNGHSQRDASDDDDVHAPRSGLQRDSWMNMPSAQDIDYTQKGVSHMKKSTSLKLSATQNDLIVHKNELNPHLQALSEGRKVEELPNVPAVHEVNYKFGDSGSQWRMTRLKAMYRQAEESGRSVDDLAVERYGDLQAFDDAREERAELDRRETYGKGYIGAEVPTGELFKERRAAETHMSTNKETVHRSGTEEELLRQESSSHAATMDQSALNRLKAQVMKAKLKSAPETAALEAQYKAAITASPTSKGDKIVILNTMENRMLSGGRNGEVKAVDTKRGRERGLMTENEDMSIEDMVREERRTRGQAGGDGRRFAERIAKDGKFDNDLNYMDENAAKLAKRVQKSEINLRNAAVGEFQKLNKVLDACPLCHHEDVGKPPIAPIVSLATRVYLTLPTEPELTPGGACVVPIQHRKNLLECDDDEWEEIRNFMKCLSRMYFDQGREVIFYENAAQPHKNRHAALTAVPLPYSLGEMVPAFFKEAILNSDEEWTQHKKLINTQSKAKEGLGKLAFRRSIAKEMPYFHVWFDVDGGLGHIVEDMNRWPKGDLFAREVLGGMLDLGPEIIKKQGRWHRADTRVDPFKKRWNKFDWTAVLTDS